MTTNRFVMSSRLTKLLPALILAASVAACSTFSAVDVAKWAEHAEQEARIVKAVAIAAAEEPQAGMPELPPNLRKCLAAAKQTGVKQKAKQPEKKKANAKVADKGQSAPPDAAKPLSADALVLKQIEDRRKVAACADAVLKWHDGLKVQKVAAK